jgi:hypothetical protein
MDSYDKIRNNSKLLEQEIFMVRSYFRYSKTECSEDVKAAYLLLAKRHRANALALLAESTKLVEESTFVPE